ncbi:hypothetical protein FOL47_006176 [Perkinsus chesapeaki]|uniref:Uncharacterized protein n=1 Tax=Perkinsus chesapeaki TaxID=330153 RepID=A0A7J6LUD2_PERCH|nr:hypothetical protein FOL47_006176 [Perkinsus chesapeaki]
MVLGDKGVCLLAQLEELEQILQRSSDFNDDEIASGMYTPPIRRLGKRSLFEGDGVFKSGLDMAKLEFKAKRLEEILEAKGFADDSEIVAKESNERFKLAERLPSDEIKEVSDLSKKVTQIELARKEQEDEINKLRQELGEALRKISDAEEQRKREEQERLVREGYDQLRPPPENIYDLHIRQEELERRLLLRELANSDSPMDRLEAEKYHWITHKLNSGPAQFQNDKWLDEQIEELKRTSCERGDADEEDKPEINRLLELAKRQRDTIQQRRAAIHARREKDDVKTDSLKDVVYPNQFEELIVRAQAEKMLMTSEETLLNNFLRSRKGRELDLPITDPVVEKSISTLKKDRRKKAKAMQERDGMEDGTAVAGEAEFAEGGWMKYDPSVTNPMTPRDREILDAFTREKDEWVKMTLQHWEEEEKRHKGNGDSDSEDEIVCDELPPHTAETPRSGDTAEAIEEAIDKGVADEVNATVADSHDDASDDNDD